MVSAFAAALGLAKAKREFDFATGYHRLWQEAEARADAADRQAESYRKDWLAAIAERDRAEARADRLETALRGLVEWGRGMVFYPDAHGPLMDAVVALGEERAQQEPER